jgi:hypothetical protein
MEKLFDRYRPEMHCMRGPRPKWLEKHGQVSSNCSRATEGELARAKGWREVVLNRLRELSAAHKQATTSLP